MYKKTKFQTMMLIAFTALAITIFSGCASIFTKSKYPVFVNSKPDGAAVTITDKKGIEVYSGSTPATITLNSSSGFFSGATYQVKFSYPGYADKTVTISSKIEGWYFGNILLGGLLGMLAIDPATGAMWKLDAEYVNATLTPNSQSDVLNLKVLDINDIPDALKSHLVKVDID